jgi:hypothetical protein
LSGSIFPPKMVGHVIIKAWCGRSGFGEVIISPGMME